MIKFISVNIEQDKHLKERVVPFLQKEKPDVLCVQELHEGDVESIASLVGPHHTFASMTQHRDGRIFGLGIFSHLPFSKSSIEFYKGSHDILPKHEHGNHESVRHALVSVSVVDAGKEYMFATTHFTLTPDGIATDYQRKDLDALLKLLNKKDDFVLTGDFNAPRGGELFTKLASVYKDNIPEQYVTSLDRDLHRAGHLDRMVDGLFTTPEYEAKNVRLECGVSDHCAIVANIEKKNS